MCFLHGYRFYKPTTYYFSIIHIKRINVRTKEQCRNERISLDLGLGNRELRFNILDVNILLSSITLTVVVLVFLKNEEYRNYFKNSCRIFSRG